MFGQQPCALPFQNGMVDPKLFVVAHTVSFSQSTNKISKVSIPENSKLFGVYGTLHVDKERRKN